MMDEVERLRAAIRKHRDQRGDDRCWMDDEELYAVLSEGYTPPKRDTSIELKNCEKYIASRHDPRVTYTSPEREIERLRTLLRRVVDASTQLIQAAESGWRQDWSIACNALQEAKEFVNGAE